MTRTVEWLNSNSHRRYPFLDNSDMRAMAGAAEVLIPDDFLIDASITSLGCGYGVCRLDSIAVDERVTTVNFTIGVAGLTNVGLPLQPDVVAEVPLQLEIPENPAYPYVYRGSTLYFAYEFTFGRGLDTVRAYGESVVPISPIQIARTCVAFQHERRVDCILGNDATLDGAASGIVEIEPGYNCDVVITSDTIKLIAGKGLGAGKFCEPMGAVPCNSAVMMLNWLRPNDAGDISITGGPGVSVVSKPDEHAIVISASDAIKKSKCEAT